jgi:hypothetical protein
LAIPTCSGSHVEKGENPRHKKLRKGEQIRPVHLSDHLAIHYLGKPADQHGQGEIVDNKKNRRQQDESGFRAEELLELWVGGNRAPVGDVNVFLRG